MPNNHRNGTNNKLLPEDQPAHDWYRFVLSFPPHLVRDYLARFHLDSRHTVLDPFCGTGTTLVECKKHGVPSIGIEASPMAAFASKVKVDWSMDPQHLLEYAERIFDDVMLELAAQGIEDMCEGEQQHSGSLRTLPAESQALLLRDSISPLPLHKALVLAEHLASDPYEAATPYEQLALANTVVLVSSNLKFGPEVGLGTIKSDAPVVVPWFQQISVMADDLRRLAGRIDVESEVFDADAREIRNLLEPETVDAVITSPPYPNEKDYTRTTRLESVLLGLIRTKAHLRAIKQGLICSNTRNVYQIDADDLWVDEIGEIQEVAEAIERRREELGKTSGFERLYARVAKLYFGGMMQHLADLRFILRPGAHLAYVVGDQASYLRVPIRTGQILGGIARGLGYQVVSLDLFRTRMATVTKEQLREEVLVLEWPHKFSTPNPTGAKEMSSTKAENRYRALIERIFKEHYNEGITEFTFEREEIEQAAAKLQFKLPKNLGDLIYSFRYLAALPESIVKLAPEGKTWLIKPAGRGRYQFALSGITPTIGPNKLLAQTKIPDATPGIIARYALSDEQALLAKLRYNRLVDIFTGVASYSLQSHLRTQVARVGQVETDEVYVGLDKRGVQYVFPVQAKGGKDKLNIVQIDQDFAMCAEKFPNLVCRPIAAQFMGDDLIAMFEFSRDDGGTAISSEKHYRLVPPDQVWPEDLTRYQKGPQD